MYYTGSCPDYRFVYDKQPPSIVGLMRHLQTQLNSPMSEAEKKVPNSLKKPV